MSLQGTFEVLDFAELLTLLARKRATGRLHLRSGTLASDLYFRDGQLSTPIGAEPLTPEASREGFARLESVCLEFLRGIRGTFEFDHRWSGPWPGDRSVKVETVLARTRRRLQEWREIEAVIPSLDVQPRVVTELGTTQVTLDRNRWRLITAIDGRRSVSGLAHALDMNTYEVCRLLKGLVDEGVVDVSPKQRRPAPALMPEEAERSSQGHIRVRRKPAEVDGNGAQLEPEPEPHSPA